MAFNFTAFVGTFLSTTDIPMAGIQDIDEHLRRRRPWARGLGPSAIKGYKDRLTERVRELVILLEMQDKELALGKLFDHFSYVLVLATIVHLNPHEFSFPVLM